MMDDTLFRPLGRLTHPSRLLRRAGTLFGGDHVPPAANVNSLDEVPNSSWFTNRIGLFPMTPAEAARGPGDGAGPAGTKWTVTSAKTQGVTPGFVVRDEAGDAYLIKFDPRGYRGMTTAAGVISNRIFHAAGYNVPEDVAVIFHRGDLAVGPDVKLKLAGGSRRPMTEEDIDALLARVDALPDGRYLALSSRFLAGTPIGPFNYHGRRKDDPNDRIGHQNRRELRGLRVFSAWINHFDTKQHNSLDMYVEEDGAGYVKHYLIDFASTLGSGANGPNMRYGYEYTLDFPAVLGRTMALGLHEDAWRRNRRPAGLDEIGFWNGDAFDPMEFKPLQPNTAFADLTDRDGYWAAKIISAFSDEHLEAIAERAGYQDPDAAAYMARILGERRDKIAKHFFDRVAPLDFFTVDGGKILFHDLGAERGVYPAEDSRYRARIRASGEEGPRGPWSGWAPLDGTEIAGPDGLGSEEQFYSIECQVDRGTGWSRSVTVHVARAAGRVVALER
jgi:hypothetical protein